MLAKNSLRNESALLALLVYLALDILAHWHPGLRGSFEFLPAELGGDVNEFVNLWVDELARNARALGFARTLYLVNPWSDGTFYSSHPGLLTFFTAIWQNLFGEGPAALRRLALLFFALRIGLLHALTARSFGRVPARLAVALYLAVPTTQTYWHALSFEVISGTLVLAAFWAQRWWARALFMAAAGLIDYTALFALPVFLWLSPRRWPSLALVASLVGAQFLWAQSFAPGAGELAGRVWLFLIGPWHVLRENPFARAQLAQALRMSFPLFVLLPLAYDLYRHGWKGRAPWWYAALSGGALFFVVFLGVFRVHPYASQLLILPLCAAAGRGTLELWQERRRSSVAVVGLMALSALLKISYPFQTSGRAHAREAVRLEAEKINGLIAGKEYTIESDLRYLKPEPLTRYLRDARWKKAGCAEYAVAYREAPPPYLELKTKVCP